MRVVSHRGRNTRKRKRPEKMTRVFYVSHPFARAIVYGYKIFELRAFKPYTTLKNKRVFIAETVTPKKFDGIHTDLKVYKARGGYVIGAVSITGEPKVLCDSHLTDEFASQCGLTLNGLKQYKNQYKTVYVWRLSHPQSFKRTKSTKDFLHDKKKCGNVCSMTSVSPLR